jgi:hypothetical protein
VAVIGSRAPIYEALCLTCNAVPTMIQDRAVINRMSEVATLTFEAASQNRYDAAIAVHVVEQAGLGMHGEPLDPNGDLALMRRLKQFLKPGGLLFLMVPTGDDYTVFNAARIYGPIRLPRLLDGWTTVERLRDTNPWYHAGNEDRSVFVLANAS